MTNPTKEQLRAREAAELKTIERDVREGFKYKEAVDALAAAELRGEHPAVLGGLRFAVAFYAPMETVEEE